MNNLTKAFYIIMFSALLSGCLEDMTITVDTEKEPESELVSEQESETEPALEPETEPETEPALEPETEPETEPALEPENELGNIEIVYSEQEFEVQFDQSLLIPLNSAKDAGEASAKNSEETASVTLISFPSLGEVSISESTIKYTPTGTLGEDSFTISIDDNITVYEQTFELLITDRSPNLVLANPTEGAINKLEDGVTIWGYNLGEQQADSTIKLCDSFEQCIEILDIVHWKNTEENLPNTLENLSVSHTIQEVKFSLPEVTTGDKFIQISNDFGTTSIPFFVKHKAFEVTFNKTSFDVQFNKNLEIPLNIIFDEEYPPVILLSIQPKFGTASIVDNTIIYSPFGTFGDDTLTVYISEGEDTVLQEFEFSIADRAPHLAFSDIISGPSTGLEDGKGAGSIVTVWGFKLGATQNNSIIELCDLNDCTEAAYVYYWKNADGQLPGGPANLFESHGMQEIAFSIPNISNGEKQINITTEHGTTALPFTVRDGNIYHVTSEGSNLNSCSFSSPCAYINGDINSGLQGGLGNGKLDPGDIVYSHGVQEPTFTGGGIEAGMFLRSIAGTEESPVAIIAYPNPDYFSTITAAHRGLNNYLSEGIVTSKYAISVGYADPSLPPNAGDPAASNYHLRASRNGRGIGNLLIQKPNTCFTGWSGAISSGGPGGQNYKAFGNHIKDLGCDNSSRYAHTLYMSIRHEASSITKPWEIAYNYLDNNNVFYGIHNYDETYSGDCGTMTGTLKIHNNVILNQRGAGINIGTRDSSSPKIACWEADIEIINNVLINVGLGVVQEDSVANAAAIQISGDLSGSSLMISNNTIYGHGDINSLQAAPNKMISVSYNWSDPLVVMNNNVFVQTSDLPWFVANEIITGSNNSFWSTATKSANNPYPLDNNIISDPEITIIGSKVLLSPNSPLIDSGGTSAFPLSIYGSTQGNTVGAVQK